MYWDLFHPLRLRALAVKLTPVPIDADICIYAGQFNREGAMARWQPEDYKNSFISCMRRMAILFAVVSKLLSA
jgi:hypothetical protein